MELEFGTPERAAAHNLIELALDKDLHLLGDLTSRSLIDENQRAEVQLVARQAGVLAGQPVAKMVFEELDLAIHWETRVADGSPLEPSAVAATVRGPLLSILTGERIVLNFLGHLSGIATLTRRFVDAVAGTQACILDTRKTLPGWRRLEKYAVRAGGGRNHRMDLGDGVLIKDNHLAAFAGSKADATIADAVRQARRGVSAGTWIEVEVDTLEQLADALTGAPDVVLLDNMDVATLREAVDVRNRLAPKVQLEASGGVTLQTVAEIAATGVERISVGALTHSAGVLDLAFDFA